MISDLVCSITPISVGSLNKIQEIVDYKKIEKNQNFVSTGNRNSSEYFLIDGVCKSFLLNPKGEEVTLSFYVGPCVLPPWKTRTHGENSFLNFQSLTDLKIGEMDSNSFKKLMIENHEIGQFGYTVLAMELAEKIDKEVNMASLGAKERLQVFRRQFSALENIVSHKDIASYLGITNITLSRLRRDLVQ